MSLSGSTIGQYHIIEQIGRGGMATVYKGYQPSLDRHVAIKILPSNLAESAYFKVRFEREAKAIAKLRHRNILTIFDHGHQADLFYLVMEYVSGGTLQEWLEWPQPLPYTSSIISQVGDALAHAHRQGIIHRDVKPGNILMVEEDWPLLSDFGLVKMVGDSLHLTDGGTSVGTPSYMSPEQAQGLAVDHRSDIYSLGVITYEMVTGQRLYGTDNAAVVFQKLVNETVILPQSLRFDLPSEVENVILKALAKAPENRFQRMEEFLAALKIARPVLDRSQTIQREVRLVVPKELPVASVPNIKSLLSPKRSFPWTRFTLAAALVLILVVIFLLSRDSLVPLVSALANVGATPPGPAAAVVASPSATVPIESNIAPIASAAVSKPIATATHLATTPTVTPTLLLSFTAEVRVWEPDGAEMVFVPAGEFIMGSDQLGADEQPSRRVYLDDFWLDRYEVSNDRFARFVAETGYQTTAGRRGWGWLRLGPEWEEVTGADWRHPRGPDSSIEGKTDHPVVLVSWNDADAYCRWAGKALPTEAQWEKAARGPASVAGSGQRYAWGNEFDSTRANTNESNWGGTTPVGTFSPQGDSPYGAADMTGNVAEWVADWYDSDYYSYAPLTNPPGPRSGTDKILRGGSWLFDEIYARTAFRYKFGLDYTYDFTGFRCVSQD